MKSLFIALWLLLGSPLYAATVLPQLSYDLVSGNFQVRDPVHNRNVSMGTIGSIGFVSTPQAISINGVAGSAPFAINAYSATQSSANYGVVPHQFNALEDFGSFGDANTHFGVVVNGGKSQDTSATTGSWQLFAVRYTGYAGSTSASFITAGQALIRPHASSYNNRGQWTGWNPGCIADVGTAPDACVATENDIQTSVAPTNVRVGDRIVDTGSSAGTFGGVTDAGISIGRNPAGIGWRNAIDLGDEGQPLTFPVAAGGNIVLAPAATQVLRSFFDLSNLQAPAIAGMVMPANSRALCFVASCIGGSILQSGTPSAGTGPQIVFQPNLLSVNFSTSVLSIDGLGNLTAPGTTSVYGVTISNSVKMQEVPVNGIPNAVAGYQTIFIDSADHKLKRKDSTGAVTVIG